MTRPARTGEAETARARYQTLAQALRRAHVLIFGMLVITAISITATIWVVVVDRPGPVYFATDPKGRITPLTPVSEPYLTDAQVIQFATEAVAQSMTITFSGWRQELTEARQYFELPNGWNSFVDALENSNYLDYIRNRRLNSTAVAQGAVITRTGTDARGRHSWILQVPIIVTYESAQEQSRDNFLAEIRLVRLPTWDVPRGIGVARISVSTGGGG